MLDSKAAEYVKRSERAAADIATWPKWMQQNLTPPRETVMTDSDMVNTYLTPPGHEFGNYTRVSGSMMCACSWRGQIDDWRQHQYDVWVGDIAKAVAAAMKGPEAKSDESV